jgi:serine/threonine-protein kinase ATR
LHKKLTVFVDNLLNFVEGIYQNSSVKSKLLPFAAEAAWSTNRWDALEKYLSPLPVEVGGDFNVNLGRLLLSVKNQDMRHLTENANQLKEHIARSLSEDTTSTLGGCRDAMLKFQILDEIQMIGSQDKAFAHPRPKIMENLDRRLEVIGAYQNDKQYVLGIRRAAMQLTGYVSQRHQTICMLIYVIALLKSMR